MQEFDSQFIEGFAKEATAAGVPEEQLPALLDLAITADLIEKDAEFSEGFVQALESAGLDKAAIAPLLLAALGAGAYAGGKKLFDTFRPAGKRMNQDLTRYQNTLRRAGVPEHLQPKLEWGGQKRQGFGGSDGGWPRPGYGVPRRWVSGYGEPGYY